MANVRSAGGRSICSVGSIAMAVVALRLDVEEGITSPQLCLISLAYVVASLCWLWRERTRYVAPQGNEFRQTYPSVEAPALTAASEWRTPSSPLTLAVAATIVVLELVIVLTA